MRAVWLLSAALLLAWGAACRPGISPDEAARIALQLHASQHASALEVMQVRDVGGLHKVTLRVAPAEFIDVFITPDGTHFTAGLRPVAEELAAQAEDRRFAECLKAAGVSILVIRSQPASVQQLQDLGRFAHLLAIPCDDDMENCRALGVTEWPTVRHKQALHPGRHTVQFLETLTGCKR